MDRVSPKVLALLALLTVVWGTNWPLFKIALDELPVLTFRAITMIVGCAMLTVILLARGESFAVPKGKWPALIAASATNILIWKVYNDGFRGQDLGGSSAQSVILMTVVILLTFVQFRFIERRVHY